MGKILSGTWKRKKINGEWVEVLVPPKKPTITWEKLVELLRPLKKKN